MTIPLVAFCRAHNIEIISFYPNSTHILQPFDIAFFHPSKDVWKRIVCSIGNGTGSFCEKKRSIQNGFRACGLSPFDPKAVDYDVLHRKKRKLLLEASEVVENQVKQSLVSNAISEDEKGHVETWNREWKLKAL